MRLQIPDSRLQIPAFALCVFTLLAVIWWFPVLQTFPTMVAGSGGDPFQTLWRFVRLGEVMRQGAISIPEEQPLLNLGPLPWMPFHFLFGEVRAYNLAWIVSAILSGWCTWLLARAWGARTVPALLAGVLVEFSPYRLSQALGHFGAMQLWWIPASMLALTFWVRSRRLRWGIVSGLLIVGTAWTEHQLFLTLILFLLVFGLWNFRLVLAHLRTVRVSAALVTLLVATGAVLPFLPVLKLAASPESYFNLGQEQRERFSARLETLFLPSPFHPFRDGMSGYGGDTHTAADRVHTVGTFLPLAIAATFLWGSRVRKDLALLSVAVVGLVLALGPVLRLGSVSIPLPGALMDVVPVASALRAMGRFVALAVVALPLLLALGWSHLVRLRSLRWVLVVLLLLEILSPPNFPKLPVATAMAETLRSLPDGGLLVIPAFTNARVASEHLYLSAYHRHPLVGSAALERAVDPRTLRQLLGTPVVSDLALLRTADFSLPALFGGDLASIAPAAFASQNIRAVLYDSDPPGGVLSRANAEARVLSDTERASVRTFLRKTLGMREEEIDSGVFLYRVPPPESSAVPVVAIRGEGWTLRHRSQAKRTLELQKSAELFLYAVRTPSAPLVLEADVQESPSRRLIVKGLGSGETPVDLPVSGRVRIPLGIPPLGRSSFLLTLDARGLIVENPRVTPE